MSPLGNKGQNRRVVVPDIGDLLGTPNEKLSKKKREQKLNEANTADARMSSQLLKIKGLSRIQVGDSVELMEVVTLGAMLGISDLSARKLLMSLKVPIMGIGSRIYFNVNSLDKALYLMLRLGEVGFASPGSTMKNKQKYRDGGVQRPTEFSVEDIQRSKEIGFITEWLGIVKSNKEARIHRLMIGLESLYAKLRREYAADRKRVKGQSSRAGGVQKKTADSRVTDTALLGHRDLGSVVSDDRVDRNRRDRAAGADSQVRSEGLGPDAGGQDAERIDGRGVEGIGSDGTG